MNKRQIGLARLAARETESISASCEIFIQYGNEFSEGSELERIATKMAKIQDQADALNRRLEKLLAPYTEIDVEEIY
jgi:hypothetical protein